ncbi:hypothetical protein AHiyo6_05920 [Arthrobacter sp. Hiyo6]|jgi:hypothetical protein|nr:hypothetical protein AHiyo6_05920 [Arthrobacter sp. Hiyo6]
MTRWPSSVQEPIKRSSRNRDQSPLKTAPPSEAREGKQEQMDSTDHYVTGTDYGTLSGRAVVVRVSDGANSVVASLGMRTRS